MSDMFPCNACGKSFHIDDLDSKPTGNPDDPRSWDNPSLECKDCYGPGWEPCMTQRTQDFGGRVEVPAYTSNGTQGRNDEA